MNAFSNSGFERLVRRKEQGRIRALGLGVSENEVCLDVMSYCAIDVILLAGRLMLLDRSAEKALVAKCKECGTALILGGVPNSGKLAAGPTEGDTYNYQPVSQDILDQVATLASKAATLKVPLATAASQFAKQHPMAASVLIGAAKTSTLERNIKALSSDVPDGFNTAFA